MSRRSENIAFKVMPNGNIRAYQADKPDKSGVSELQFTNPENVSPTVIVGNTIKVIETKSMYMKELKNDLSVVQYPHGFNYGFEYTDGICPSITISSWQHNNFIKMAEQRQIELPEELRGKKFRIRKLTPRECFRLMGVDDKDIDKIQAAGVSNSGQYKLAGNSIVVDVLFHLFRKMFIEKDMDITKGSQQLSLF